MSQSPESTNGRDDAPAPRISIVVPSFNQARFLRDCLESLVQQRYPNLEVIVVDGGSTDESIEIVKEFAGHITSWTSEPDGGQADAINKGIAKTTGTLLGWLNSDDYLLPDALTRVASVHRHAPNAGLIAGNGLRVNEQRALIAPFAPVPIRIEHDALRLGIDYLLQPSTFFTREAWDAVGGLREDLNWTLDWDLWIRISARFPGEAIDAYLAASREYGETKTATGAFKRWQEIRALAEEHTGMALTPGALAYFLDTLQNYFARDADARELMPGLLGQTQIYWARMSQALVLLTGRPDGFPVARASRATAAGAEDAKRAELAELTRTMRAHRRSLSQCLLEEIDVRSQGEMSDTVRSLQVHLQLMESSLTEREEDARELRERYREAVEALDWHAGHLRNLDRSLLVRLGRLLRVLPRPR